MKFSQFFSDVIESKKNSLDQLKLLVEELEKELKTCERDGNGENQETCKERIRKRYARIANRTIKDLFFSVDDFAQDPKD